jgi:hypothetical protein
MKIYIGAAIRRGKQTNSSKQYNTEQQNSAQCEDLESENDKGSCLKRKRAHKDQWAKGTGRATCSKEG